MHAEDWSQVRVAPDFNPAAVRNAGLYGRVRLGSFHERLELADKSATLPSGVYDSDLCDVVVGDNALVSRTSLVSKVVIEPRACIFGCGQVACTGVSRFACSALTAADAGSKICA